MHLLDRNFSVKVQIWLNCIPEEPNDNANFGLGRGLAPVRRQVFIWTTDELVHWYIYASLDLDELNVMQKSSENTFLKPVMYDVKCLM